MIDLPARPAPQRAVPFLIDKGGILEGGLGSADQRFNRLGNRFGIAVTMPPMLYPKTGRIWVSRLIDAQEQGARMAWPLQGFDPGAPGAVVVNGSGQAGGTLNIRGATPGYVFREGQFGSIVTGGEHHVYKVRTETIVGDAGTAALPITPMIRVQHIDGDVCHFGVPKIQGFIQGDQRQWEAAVATFTSIEFELRERK